MDQHDHSIVSHSNIQSDAIIVNQSNEFKKEVFTHNKHTVQFLTFDERGVGLSRNTALMRADSDIVLFADNDITYVDEYSKIIISAFEQNPTADIIMFNVPSLNLDRPSADITKRTRIRKHNCLKFGTYRMAARLDSIRAANLSFSLLFGGGAKYSSGEDSLFIFNSIQKGLKILALPLTIGEVSHEESTWFNGYTDVFFHDKGALFTALSPAAWPILCIQYILRKHGLNKQTCKRLGLMIGGSKHFRGNKA